MIVRPATTEDARGIAEVHVRSWQAAYRGLYPQDKLDAMSVDDAEVRQRQWLGDDRAATAATLVVEDRRRVVGFATLAKVASEDRGGPAGELHGIYLHPDGWRQGTGTLLWQEVEQVAQAAGWKWLFVRVFTANARARRFYEAMGCVGDESSTRVQRFEGTEIETMRYWCDLQAASEELVPALERLAETELSDWPAEWTGFTWPGYTYEHTLRVRCLGVTIAHRLGADCRVVELAALLHDMGKPLGEPHSETGAHRADQILSDLGVDRPTRKAVCSIIRSHLDKDAGDPAEALALYDADFIDANYGYVAITRYIAIRAHRQQAVEEMAADGVEWLSGMEKKLDQVFTEAGRPLATERYARMRAYLAQLQAELKEPDDASGWALSLARFIASDSHRPSLLRQLAAIEGVQHESESAVPLHPSPALCQFARALREEIQGSR